MDGPVLWQVRGWNAGERHPPGTRYWWDNRRRDEGVTVLQYTVAGELLFSDRAGEHRVPPSHAALFRMPSDSAYGLAPDARETYVADWVDLRGAGIPEHLDEVVRLRGPVMPLDAGTLAQLHRVQALADVRAATPPERLATEIHTLVMLLCEGARTARAGGLRPVDRAVEAMLASPAAPWSVKSLAERHGVSREHLARAFRERVGLPPAAWLAQERVRRAVALLEQTDLPVRAVRDQAGFTSSHALLRRLRAATGLGPLELRRRRRG